MEKGGGNHSKEKKCKKTKKKFKETQTRRKEKMDCVQNRYRRPTREAKRNASRGA